MLKSGSVLAIDWGQKKVGLAFADAFGISVNPRRIFQRKNVPPNLSWTLQGQDLLELQKAIEEDEPQSLLLGIPVHMSSEATENTAQALELAQKIAQHFQLPVFVINETLSSWASQKEYGTKKWDDAGAAAILLKDFISELSLGRETRCFLATTGRSSL